MSCRGTRLNSRESSGIKETDGCKAPRYRLFQSGNVVLKSKVNTLIPELKAAGAEDILEIPITKIVR
jgi:ATP phosphoribosyltransferase